jgi:hypothetical protein
MFRILALAALLALLAVPAFARSITESTEVNLDADPDPEQIVPLTVADPSGIPEKSIVVYDQCGGTEHAYKLGTPQENVDVLVQEVDGVTARPELRLIGSSGAAGGVGFISRARLGSDRRTGGCPKIVPLFRWTSTEPSPKPPKGYSVSNFGVRYKDLTPRYQGKEIELTEGLASRRDPACCPSKRRVSRWRYDSSRDRYVRYLAKLKALKRR